MDVKEAIDSRFSARAFLDRRIEKGVIEAILQRAARAPSGSNMQPWKVYVVSGDAREKLTDAALSSVTQNSPKPSEPEPPEYDIYPKNLPDPYNTRRFETGMALYAALGIERSDKVARNAQLLENYRFFGAPVGLIFAIEKIFVPGQLGDLGMFMQNVMLLARDHGLHTCPQAAWQLVNRTVHRVLEIPEEELIYSGMAMGYLDTEHPANSLYLDRLPIESYTRFAGFGD